MAKPDSNPRNYIFEQNAYRRDRVSIYSDNDDSDDSFIENEEEEEKGRESEQSSTSNDGKVESDSESKKAELNRVVESSDEEMAGPSTPKLDKNKTNDVIKTPPSSSFKRRPRISSSESDENSFGKEFEDEIILDSKKRKTPIKTSKMDTESTTRSSKRVSAKRDKDAKERKLKLERLKKGGKVARERIQIFQHLEKYFETSSEEENNVSDR